MVELFDDALWVNSWTSSKGNQLKWETKGGIWYKADNLGYEGLSESVVSHLLSCSTMDSDEYVIYESCQIKYKKTILNGCKSNNFLCQGESLITLERLFKLAYNRSFLESVFRIADHADRLRFIVDTVTELTGIDGFGEYISKLLTADALFLNDDRHLHNVAVIRRPDGSYRLCPVFDMGAGLLSDTSLDYPAGGNIDDLIASCRPKTFCEDFEEQVEICEKLYGDHIRFSFSRRDVMDLLKREKIYSEGQKERVFDVIMAQKRRYGYLFK